MTPVFECRACGLQRRTDQPLVCECSACDWRLIDQRLDIMREALRLYQEAVPEALAAFYRSHADNAEALRRWEQLGLAVSNLTRVWARFAALPSTDGDGPLAELDNLDRVLEKLPERVVEARHIAWMKTVVEDLRERFKGDVARPIPEG